MAPGSTLAIAWWSATNGSTVLEQPKVVIKETPISKKDEWELKDRVYFLKGRQKPLSRMIRSANIFWFDEGKGYETDLTNLYEN